MAKVKGDDSIASDMFQYVDDVRPCGETYEDCCRASRTFAPKCSYYEIQDAAWKMKSSDRKPGPWAGTMVYMDSGGGVVGFSEEVGEKPETH